VSLVVHERREQRESGVGTETRRLLRPVTLWQQCGSFDSAVRRGRWPRVHSGLGTKL